MNEETSSLGTRGLGQPPNRSIWRQIDLTSLAVSSGQTVDNLNDSSSLTAPSDGTPSLFVVGVRFEIVIANLNCKIDLKLFLED